MSEYYIKKKGKTVQGKETTNYVKSENAGGWVFFLCCFFFFEGEI